MGVSLARQQGFLAAFNYQNFRYFWIATMLSSAGRWMEAVIFSWAVLQMTGSPFLVGVVSACRWVGYGLGPVFGALADRYDKRNMFLIITSSSVLYSLVLALLIMSNLAQYWHVMLIALIAGLAHGFDLPLRYAFMSDLVDKRMLTSAVALNTVAVDVTAVLGPAIAGPMINVIGIGGVVWILTANYAFNVWAMYVIRGAAPTEKAAGDSISSNLKEGARYILRHPPIFALIAVAVVFNLFQYPTRYILVAVFADEVLQVGASGYGFLLASSGAGALIGAIVVAFLADIKYKAWLCIITSLAAGIFAGAFARSSWYPLSLGLIGGVGVVEAISMITMAALLMLLTPQEMRGRVMGVRSMAVLPLTLGSLISGAIAGQFGAPAAATINAFLQVSAMLAIALLVPSLRKSG